ncbi:MAG: glycogen/starch/alpha-glucan phosphorylase [Nitrospirae bacterium]|nr:glycogen/starch/alpha-glucan phosphorylase [Nitrospirota bacterium]
MTLALNGALTVCTLDGANIEMKEEIGDENIFVFGLHAGEVENLKRTGYNPYSYYQSNPELARAIDMIANGFFSPWCRERFHGLSTILRETDNYMLLADYADYVNCQEKVSSVYLNPEDWTKKSIINVASMGKFSSDRTIKEYAGEIWGLAS